MIASKRIGEDDYFTNDIHEMAQVVQRVSHRLERSRASISLLSHEIKTPLAAIVQIANNQKLDDLPELRQSLLEHTRKIQRELEYRLKHIQLAGVASVGTCFNPAREMAGMMLVLKSIYRHKHIYFDIEAPDLNLHIDRQDCLELLGSLLDNACKWANQFVRIHISHEDENLLIVVEDDGPGCTEAELIRLCEAGSRQHQRCSEQGLGVLLVKSIIELYSGSFTAGQSESLGGFSSTAQIKCRSRTG